MTKQKKETRAFINIGEDRVSVAIGRPQRGSDGKVELLGAGDAFIESNELSSYRKQLIIAIKNAVSRAETAFKTRIDSVWVCISDPYLVTVNGLGKTFLNGEIISNEHMIDVLTNAKNQTQELLAGRHISHLISQRHWRDGVMMSLQELMEKKDSYYGEVSASFHLMGQTSESYNNIMSLFQGMNFYVEGIIFDMLAGAKYALTDDEKEEGVLFFNLGERCSSYAFYADNVLVGSASFPIGTKQLLDTFKEKLFVSKKEARAILNNYARLMLRDGDPARLLKIHTYEGETSVNAKFLHEMVEPHYFKVFDTIFKDITKRGIRPNHIPMGVVLSGEGARVGDIRTYMASVNYIRARHTTINPNIQLHEKFIIGEADEYEKLTHYLGEPSNRLALGAMLYYFQESIHYQRDVYGTQYSDVESREEILTFWEKLKAKIPMLHANQS